MITLQPVDHKNGFLDAVETYRIQAAHTLKPKTRAQRGQYFTPLTIANLMASMTPLTGPDVHILDPGAGVGILSAALISKLLQDNPSVHKISVTAYEIDESLHPYLESTLKLCQKSCKDAQVAFDFTISGKDFIEDGAKLIINQTQMSLFEDKQILPRFNLIIANPPYKKISSQSQTRQILRKIGIETSNLYAAFIAVALMLMDAEGHLIAITPRSFCNGPYFKPFRQFLFENASFKRIHIFKSREKAFSEDEVLQENIIYHLLKDPAQRDRVLITSNDNPDDKVTSLVEVSHSFVINNTNPNKFIHIATDELSKRVIERVNEFSSGLDDLGLRVSTGRVVDFRAEKFIRQYPAPDTVPLIYPLNIQNGSVKWPQTDVKKSQAIVRCQETDDLLVDNGIYVITKRFTSKEQHKRIVAAIHNPDHIMSEKVAFENHLNYFHQNGTPLNRHLAFGLAIYLNSTLIDMYFRIFNGHTQVNATDLRAMNYPTLDELEQIGRLIGNEWPDQDQIDLLVERNLLIMSDETNPVAAAKKIKEAISILELLGLPKAQQNERSGLTLLALLNLKANEPWSNAKSPLMGITEMMNFFEAHYGKRYAPNTRETVRRFTVHQFIQAGIVIPNPDKPRPVNSPNYVYQIDPGALKLIREFGTQQWSLNLPKYLDTLEMLKERYAQARQMRRVPVKISDETEITLSPGGQNILIKMVLEEFCPRFTPNATLVYLGDTEAKWAYFDTNAFEALGIPIPEEHGKIPDVVVHYTERNWLVLIEAVTSHGPVNPKRKIELEELFAGSEAGLVFVTAFIDRKTLMRYLSEIAWETEVWVSESPDHMIHFNGERFLGPYSS